MVVVGHRYGELGAGCWHPGVDVPPACPVPVSFHGEGPGQRRTQESMMNEMCGGVGEVNPLELAQQLLTRNPPLPRQVVSKQARRPGCRREAAVTTFLGWAGAQLTADAKHLLNSLKLHVAQMQQRLDLGEDTFERDAVGFDGEERWTLLDAA